MEQNKFSVLEKIIKNIATTNVNSNAEANVEVEGGEKLLPPNEGKVFDVEGKKHKDGGVKMNLESGTLVLSDYSKIKEGKKYIEDKYDVNIKKDTFSSVLKKIENKIGLTKIDNEIVDLTKKLEKNEKVEDENTKNLNLQALSEKLTSLNGLKERKEAVKTEAFQELYNIQEAQKENEKYFEDDNGVKVKFEDGGKVMFRRQDIPILREKYGNVDLVTKFQELKKGGKLKSYKQGGKVVENGVQYMQRGSMVDAGYENTDLSINNNRVTWNIPTLRKDVNANLQDIAYDPQSGKFFNTKTGLEATNVSNWNPYSTAGRDWLNKGTGSLMNILPQNSQFRSQLQGVLNRAETSKDILDADQGIRQNVFRDALPNTFKRVSQLGAYPTTEGALRNVLSYKGDNETKAKVMEWAKKKNLLDSKGNVKGGYFTQNPLNKEDLTEINSIISGAKEDGLKDAYAQGLMLDSKMDRRLEHFQKLRFNSKKEKEDYANKEGFEIVKEADGNEYWIDKANPNNIYTPEVLRRKKVGKEDYDKWSKIQDGITEGGRMFKKTSEPNVYDEYYTEDQPTPKKVVETPSDVAKTSEVADFQTYKRKPRQQYLPPSVRTYTPSPLQLSTLLVPEMRDATFTKVSPELALRENNRSLDIMGRQLENTGDTSVLAGFSDLAGKMFSANNEAVSRANEMNMQSRVNYDNLMSQRSDAQENTRLGTLGQNEKNNQQAWLNTSNDWRDYYKQRDLNEIGMFRDMASMNLAEAMTPDEDYNPFTGQLTSTPYQFNPNQYSQIQRMMSQALEDNNKKTTKK